MMTLSDYVIDFLVKKGIKEIFLVSGGGIMYLTDAIYRNKEIKYISNHHEQASAISAEAWSRVKKIPGACLVTTGPGATNAITGVACAWFDSIPMVVISGQQKTELIADYKKFRNLGPQEANIIPMVKPITKYVVQIRNPKKIRYELEYAYYISTTGRPGPVWIDIPQDMQGKEINPKDLIGFTPPVKKILEIESKIINLIDLIKLAKRPLLILGNGIRLSNAEQKLIEFLKKVNIPVVLPFGGLDLLYEDHPLLVGKFGPGGQRRGNFALQNSDLILSIGASLNVASTGFDFKSFAPNAKKIMVNIDKNEFKKPTINIDYFIESDVTNFFNQFLHLAKKVDFKTNIKWLEACENWKEKYKTIVPNLFKDKKHVNSYVFFDTLSKIVSKDNVLVTGIGLDAASMYQGYPVKQGQRAFVNKNFGPMGWCLPASIGACIANNRKMTILVAGDGSFQLNIQELSTIMHNKLPIKIFIFNNGLYESIRATQNNLFNGRLVGADKSSGVSAPNFKNIAEAYNMRYFYIKNNSQIKNGILKAIKSKGPVICEVNISYEQKRTPKAVTYKDENGVIKSRPLHDMAPLLSRKELDKNMNLFDK